MFKIDMLSKIESISKQIGKAQGSMDEFKGNLIANAQRLMDHNKRITKGNINK